MSDGPRYRGAEQWVGVALVVVSAVVWGTMASVTGFPFSLGFIPKTCLAAGLALWMIGDLIRRR